MICSGIYHLFAKRKKPITDFHPIRKAEGKKASWGQTLARLKGMIKNG